MPALVLLMGQDQRVAQGVSLMVIIPTALSATATNLRAGLVDSQVALWVTPAAVVLALSGGFVAGEIADEWLSRIFGVVVLYVGTRSLLKNWRAPQPAPAAAAAAEDVD